MTPQIPVEPEQTGERRVDVAYDGQTLPLLLGRLQAARVRAQRTARASPPSCSPSSRSARRAKRIAGSCSTSRWSRSSTRASTTTAIPGCSTSSTRVKDPAKVDYVLGVIDATIAQPARSAARRRAARRSAAAPALRLRDGAADAGRRRAAGSRLRRAHGRPRRCRHGSTPTVRRRSRRADVQRAAVRSAYLARHARRTVGVPPSAPQSKPTTPWYCCPSPPIPRSRSPCRSRSARRTIRPARKVSRILTGEMLADAATEKRSLDEILAALYPLAASYGMRVDLERTTLTGRMHRDNVDAYLELYTDAFLRPAFDEQRLRARAQRRDQRSREHAALLLRRGARQSGAARVRVARHALRAPERRHGSRTASRSRSTTCARSTAAHFTRRQRAARHRRRVFRHAWSAQLQAAVRQLPARRRAGRAADRPVRADRRPLGGAHRRSPAPTRRSASAFRIDVHRGERDFYALWIANSWLGEHRNSVEPPVQRDPRDCAA